ncbi:MAG: SDR family oxidoreductase [Candidatus Altiarchaeota archaeon]|nr:SDR family oxidoreductase [Candidatus Altiarchaeota archaeon]
MKIVVTGGSRGIGRLIVGDLIKEHEVIVVSKSKESTDRIKDELGVKAYSADVTDYLEIEKTFRKIGSFDALINCAGVLGPVGPISQTDMKQWKKTLDVNLIGTVNCCKAAISHMSGKGKIINLSGGGAAYPRIYHSAYAASKAAVVRFTENLAQDLLHDGTKVAVNVVAPGAHKTDLWGGETFDEEPGQWADPQLLFKLIRFLLSKESDGVNGRFIHIKDDYLNFDKSDQDMFTMRRIDDFKYRRK